MAQDRPDQVVGGSGIVEGPEAEAALETGHLRQEIATAGGERAELGRPGDRPGPANTLEVKQPPRTPNSMSGISAATSASASRPRATCCARR